jgi:cell division protein FtsI (penicillin-binding protein 3)
MKTDPKFDMLWKTYLVYFIVLVVGITVITKIILLQTKERAEYKDLAQKKEYHHEIMKANRGNIYAYNGDLLATTIPIFHTYFDPRVVADTIFDKGIDSLCLQLADLFPKRNAEQWKQYLTKSKEGSRQCTIERNVTLPNFKKMQRFAVFNKGTYAGGLAKEELTLRIRPYNDLAGCLIGYVKNIDKRTYYGGLEATYNKYLKGEDGKRLVRRLHHWGNMPVESEDDIEPQDGNDVVTTFDIKLQDIVESALHNTMTTNNAEQGCAILMDVETGYIRAIANLQRNAKTGDYEETFNFAISALYEPGSVFKIASMIVLLNHNHDLKLDDKVNIGTGPIKFSNRTMKDDHSFARNGICTVQEVIEQSSNKGTAVLITKAFMAHPEQYVDGLYALGLNKMIGTGLAVEAHPYIKHPTAKDRYGNKIWSNVSLPWMSIGYEVNVTPLQLLMLYNAIANNGKMMKPQFVSEIRNGNQTIEKYDPVVLNEQIAPAEGIKMLQTMLEGVTVRGTARRPFEGCSFPVAGKTGTAQYCDSVFKYKYREPGISRKLYNTTFVGYFPADKPKYSCIVVVSRARGARWAAGSVSAPGFREIAEKVYAHYCGILEDNDTTSPNNNAVSAPVIMHNDKAHAFFNGINMNYYASSTEAEWVSIETNPEGVKLISNAVISNKTVPNVVGMNVTDAVYLLESMGIKTRFQGQGIVTEQSLPAGDSLRKNSVMNLKLAMK